MGLSCYGMRNRFSELLDDQLSPTERESLLAHLAGCERCAGDFELFRKSHDLVLGLKPLEVSPDFTERVLARVREQRPEDRELSWSAPMPPATAPRGMALVPGGNRIAKYWTTRMATAAAVAALSVGSWFLMAHPRASTGIDPIAHQAAAQTASPHQSASTAQQRQQQEVPPQFAVVPSSGVASSSSSASPSGSASPIATAGAAHHAHKLSHHHRAAPVSGGPALAGKAPGDSLYEQPFERDIPASPVYTRPVNATPDTAVHVVPATRDRGGN